MHTEHPMPNELVIDLFDKMIPKWATWKMIFKYAIWSNNSLVVYLDDQITNEEITLTIENTDLQYWKSATHERAKTYVCDLLIARMVIGNMSYPSINDHSHTGCYDCGDAYFF